MIARGLGFTLSYHVNVHCQPKKTIRASMSTAPPAASQASLPCMATHGASASVLWLRRDLRLHDNEALLAACDASRNRYLLPVYVLDPERDMEPRRTRAQGGLGVPKLGPHRLRCEHECECPALTWAQ